MKRDIIERMRNRNSVQGERLYLYSFTHFLTLLNVPIAVRVNVDPVAMELLVFYLRQEYESSCKTYWLHC